MMSSDNKSRFKNKHVLEHLAKSSSENPRKKKKNIIKAL